MTPASRILARLRARPPAPEWDVDVDADGDVVVRGGPRGGPVAYVRGREWAYCRAVGGPYAGRGWPEALADDLADTLLLPRYPLLARTADTCWGATRIAGTRVAVDVVCAYVAAGDSPERVADVLALDAEAVRQALALWGRAP